MTDLRARHIRVLESLLEVLEMRAEQAEEQNDDDGAERIRTQMAARAEELAALLEEDLEE
ncbi:hypothetical protein GQE99_14565 [Maritimibacter sp. DP07]|uniref:Uncharacterized protein n=1 Tax=Maritimibacter harenae TaxID=2606218 RepID=A0A845M974_9RHOB|nr:hypothetical protein [Maritimibacter harenae]MZR14243.1 hypothetical protein [Maritimibacter harenae]